MIETVDYHAGGEPFRIVLSGAPDLPGETVAARRAAVSAEADAVRRLLCHEPRGHADMYGCFLVPPDDDGAAFGVLFWHKDGFSTACGHGTIALGAWAGKSVVIDVPSGRVRARVDGDRVRFRNVLSYVLARDVPVTTSYGAAAVDVSYGGAIYASVRARDLGLEVVPAALGDLIAAGREVKAAVSATDLARHPDDDRLSGVYGTILYEELGEGYQRNVTVFADGQVDRSPCGSGTSARLALLDGDVLVHDSIIGTRFTGRVVERTAAGVITEIEGTAYRTGEHRFALDPRDELGTGFVLR